jgi:threonine aldolase
MPVDTNIVIFKLIPEKTVAQVLDELGKHGVKAVRFNPSEIRMVTHLDFTDELLDYTINVLTKLSV